MQRGHWWIIGGCIVLAAAILAVALVARNRERADSSAQAALRNALVTAKTHYTEGSTYAGLDPEVAARIEPSLAWNTDEPASVGVISINLATDDDVVLSTMSASGTVFCIAERDEGPEQGTYYGAGDAHGAVDATSCTGSW